MMTQMYCPSCGEDAEIDTANFMVIPGLDNVVTCPICGTVWRIVMEFYEIEGDEEKT